MRPHMPNDALVELMLKDRGAVPADARPTLEPPMRPLVPLAFPRPNWRYEAELAAKQEAAEAARRAAQQAQDELEPPPPPRPRKWGLR